MGFTHELIEADANIPVKYIIHTASDPVSVPRHWHEAMEISYTAIGSVQNFYIDGQNYTTKPGDILVINSNAIHSILPLFEENRKALSIFFPYSFLQEHVPNISEIEFCCFLKEVSDGSLARLQGLLADFIVEAETGKRGLSSLRLTAIMYDVLYLLIKNYSVQKRNTTLITTEKHLARLTKMIAYMKDNYAEELSVSDLAAHFNLTPEYFSRFFKRYMDSTVLEYLELIRLGKAHQLLMNTDKTISYIAHSCGFPNEKSFTRVFKKVYKITPNKYRLQGKNHNLTV
ncbi:AraC family transcriptional regulator [Listeria weihenstephanensis FSL R9-0317]|uniref:AraC family transcriptional regulator n=1 Tax=Listeria weihenstephanensis TaxID=1006155 RepID=A0A1S7FQJ8_9LIST|nr:AraC family transcriptional regulator [Listeria weihenstephanensis]AQY49683.1 hypothetical protein UE46_00460 [Listeria weihenstephanensis]EUJ39618.1 AraC family transcriptional regulator [Listeria weihenstephanensis FSL R9-0317]MBC1499119.1 AraC family transcriptional regulator [Listeria weihenstephanensis]